MASVMIAKGIRASMQIIRGPEIENHIDDLGRFRIEIFREYPYLYDGNIEFERVYLSPYSRNPESLLLILQDAHGIIGACTGTPLTSLCTVDRGLNHPRRPGNYCPPDYLWEKYGFVKSTNLLAYLAWTDIGQKIETQKPMNIWFKINSEKEE